MTLADVRRRERSAHASPIRADRHPRRGDPRRLRALGHLAGPRRCGLLLGVPSSTTLMLLYCGYEHGVGGAMVAAESSLLGLVAAAMLPLAYARATRVGSRPLLAPASAIAGYLAIASVSRIFPDPGPGACLGLSVVGVLAACALAGRVPIAAGASRPGTGTWLRLRELALGTAVPATLVVAVKMVGVVGGVDWAGLFTTFPGMSLAVLVVTHLEAGPAAACRMAKAMPPGNLVTIGFLAAFLFFGPRLGLGWGTACGYAVALATLLALEGLVRPMATPAHHHRRSAPRFVPIPWHAPLSALGGERASPARREVEDRSRDDGAEGAGRGSRRGSSTSPGDHPHHSSLARRRGCRRRLHRRAAGRGSSPCSSDESYQLHYYLILLIFNTRRGMGKATVGKRQTGFSFPGLSPSRRIPEQPERRVNSPSPERPALALAPGARQKPVKTAATAPASPARLGGSPVPSWFLQEDGLGVGQVQHDRAARPGPAWTTGRESGARSAAGSCGCWNRS